MTSRVADADAFLQQVRVDNFWIERPVREGWVVAYRVAATPDGSPVIAELRIFPDDPGRRPGEWSANSPLRRQPQLARQIAKKLVTGPIKFTPKRDKQGRGYFEFEAEGSLAKLLTNGVPILVSSPTGFEPVFWP